MKEKMVVSDHASCTAAASLPPIKEETLISEDDCSTDSLLSIEEETVNEDVCRLSDDSLPTESLFQCQYELKSCDQLNLNENGEDYRKIIISNVCLFYQEFDRITYASLSDKEDGVLLKETGVDFFPCNLELMILSSCNGLLLCLSIEDTVYYICNPATKEFIPLPQPHDEVRYHLVSGWAGLVFDPDISHHFKVVLFRSSTMLDVFSSEMGEWVEYKVFPEFRFGRISCNLVSMNGALYMIVHPWRVEWLDIDGGVSFKQINMPVEKTHKAGCCLGVCRGRLYYAWCHQSRLQVWKLICAETSEWRLEHEACLSLDLASAGLGSHRWEAVGFHQDCEVVFLSVGCKLFFYHLKNRKRLEASLVGFEGGDDLCERYLFPFSPYLESLKDAHSHWK